MVQSFARFLQGYFITGLILILGFMMSGDAKASKENLEFVAGMPENFPPHFFIDSESGKPQGFGVDVMDAVAQRCGITVVYKTFKNWKETNQAAREGQIDIIPNMGFTAERKAFMDFTPPYETFRINYYIRSTSSIRSLETLKNPTIGVVTTNKARFILEQKETYNLIVVNSFGDLAWKLIAGDVDIIAMPEPVMNKLMQRSGLTDHVKTLGKPLVEIKRGIAVTKGRPELLQLIRSQMSDFIVSQEYRDIYTKWYGKPDPYWTTKRIGLVSGLLLFLIIVAAIYWRYRFIARINSELETTLRDRTRKIEESQKRYKQMFLDNQAIKLVIDPEDGRIIEANDAACDFYQYPLSQLLSMNIADINTLSPDEIGQKMSEAKAQDRAQFHFTHKLANGEIRDVEVYSGPINLDEKTLLFSIVHDISKRKVAEEALRASEERLRKILDNSPFPTAVVDPGDENIIYWSKSALEMFGHNPQKVNEWYQLAYPDNQYREEVIKRWKPFVEKALQSKRAINAGEYQITGKDGTVRTCELYAQYIPDHLIVSLNDITERKMLEQQLLQAQKMESIGTLAGGIAHDFNNILSAIIGFTELALQGAEKGSSQEDDLREVHAAGARAKELVKQILAFARQSEEEVKPVRPVDIIDEILKLIRPSTPTSIQILTDFQSNASILANPNQFHQVVMNLCSNSIFALQTNGDTLEISLKDVEYDKGGDSSGSSDKYVELTISDNGQGIEPAIIENIFEPYFTTKQVGEGTGMGLAMVKGIVENWGGQISVRSIPGKKTTFTVILPTTTTGAYDQDPQLESYAMGSEHILFIDDEPPIAKMGSRMLESLGYQVTIRSSSVEALELFKEKYDVFDLVISDMTMPFMTGDQLAIEFRKIRRDIPIIICTGYSNKMNEEKAKQIGINAFAFKPFTKSDFAQTVRQVLDT